MATNAKAAEPAAGEKAPAKSKKMLIIIIAAVAVLAIGGVAAFFVLKSPATEEAEEAPAAKPKAVKKPAAHAKSIEPPVYLPMDSMVVNLADPGGERVAQIGVTLEVEDAHTVDTVKPYLPKIRSGVLMLIARRTAEELLKPEGKDKLAEDILVEASLPFGGEREDEEDSPKSKKKKKKSHGDFPVVGVLFSSFIVQ